jgi:baculoviral IAP repeat-containing protein 6
MLTVTSHTSHSELMLSIGAFQFDIYCPPDYPKVPPLVNLQTTGGGSVRFNPNLYNCGKVCLSLLGTWKGAENEKWNAKTSTLLQVFISIQSLILVEEPYFNEPGYETEIGKPSGIQHSREYNEVIRVATMKWAMLEQLKKPSPGFEEVITTHFKLKRNEILKQCSEWVKEASTSKTSGHYEKIKKVYEELQKELQKLDPSPLQIPDLQNK